MEPENLTIQILRQIRDAAEKTNERIDQTNARLDQTNARLDQTNVRLDRVETGLDKFGQRVVESEVRTTTAITELGGTMHEIKDMLSVQLDLRGRVERCEDDIRDLKGRLKA